MKTIHKLLTLVLALCLVLGCFSGCNQNISPAESGPAQTDPTDPIGQYNEISDVAEFEAERSFAFFWEQANLKETSLFHLSNLCGIGSPEEFTRRFIARDREVRL